MTGDQWAIIANTAAIVINVWWTIRLDRAVRRRPHRWRDDDPPGWGTERQGGTGG